MDNSILKLFFNTTQHLKRISERRIILSTKTLNIKKRKNIDSLNIRHSYRWKFTGDDQGNYDRIDTNCFDRTRERK